MAADFEVMNNMVNLFKEYNDIVKKAYFDYYLEVEEKPFSVYEKTEEEFERKLEKSIRKWEYKPSKSVGGESPSEYFSSVNDLGLLMEAFKKGSKICDRGLPNSFINKIGTFGDEAVGRLASLAFDRSLIDNEDNRIISLLAIKVLGMWKDSTHLRQLVELLKEYAGKIDIVAEEIKEALISAGKEAAEILSEEIDRTSQIEDAHVYMIMALAQAGKEHKAETTFKSLKNAFRKMDKKAVGAICLGIYGDGRAIPLLRGYAERNIDTIDRMTFYEIKSQVEILGGNMDDIAFKYYSNN